MDGLTGKQANASSDGVESEQKQSTPAPIQQHLSPEAKAENQRKAEALRAKLLAKQASRQNTPSNKPNGRASTSSAAKAPETPTTKPASLAKEPAAFPSNKQQSKAENKMEDKVEQPEVNIPGLDELLKHAKAAADAQTAALAAQEQPPIPKEHAQKQTNGISNLQNKPKPNKDEKPTAAPAKSEQPKKPTRPSNLSDTYYADLPAWLEVTGYHDVEYRNSKLRTYKARVQLEKEQARIQEALEKLRQEEQEQAALR